MRRNWTAKEIEYLMAAWGKVSLKQIAKRLSRNEKSVANKVTRLRNKKEACMYSIICEKCGNEFSAVNKKTRYCPDCVPAVKAEQWQRRREQMNRPCTADTEFLICVYTYRGEIVKRIAADFNRSAENVKMILNSAKSSGRYGKHIQKHLNYLNYKSTLSDDYVESSNAILGGYK